MQTTTRRKAHSDPVLIDFPRGYSPAISRNKRSHFARLLRLGGFYSRKESPGELRRAIAQFDEALAFSPESAEALAWKASVRLLQALHAYEEPIEDRLAEAEALGKRALASDPSSWRANAALGSVCLYRQSWEDADLFFRRAEEVSLPDLSEDSSWGPYLIARGDYARAIGLARRYESEFCDDILKLNRSVLYLYALRRFDEAHLISQQVLLMDRNFWQGHLYSALLSLQIDEPDKALDHMLQIGILAGESMWPGFRVLCLSRSGQMSEAKRAAESLRERSRSSYVQNLQITLCCLATDRPTEAIDYLKLATIDHDPAIVWLHVYPVFDSLRGFPEFQRLLRSLRLPHFDVV